jgi:hypothetical protein
MTTELIALAGEKCEDDKFAVCYAKGSSFRKDGHLYRVEKGARTVVHRSLCLIQYFEKRCTICPHSKLTVTLEVTHGPGSSGNEP